MTRRDQPESERHRPVERIFDATEAGNPSDRTLPKSRRAMPSGKSDPRFRPVGRQSLSTRSEPAPRAGADADPDTATLHTHRYTVRLATTQLDHERETSQIVRAMSRKKWAVESRDAIPGASDRETVTILTFVQTTTTERTPNAPVSDNVVKSGASVPRRFR